MRYETGVDEGRLKAMLDRVKRGETDSDQAVAELRELPFVDLGFAVVDHHRALRQGVAEVILGEGKTPEQVVAIAKEITRVGHNALITRVDSTKASALREAFDDVRYVPLARTCMIEVAPVVPLGTANVALVSAGTSDLAVAEECAETMRALGVAFERVYDVGVAGIHRVLQRRSMLAQADLIIVVAGMEGALASVIGGLVDIPVIAVPTSIGYGAAFGGIAAMLGMLTSCASGITVCNIDNGFGAAFAAARMIRMQLKGKNNRVADNELANREVPR